MCTSAERYDMKDSVPSRPSGFFSDYDRYLFGQGTHYEIYKKLGAHRMTVGGQSGTYFACWAPHAQDVSVIGDFNGWDYGASYMERVFGDIFELFIPGAKEGQLYKYHVHGADGSYTDKADPYSVSAESRPGTASRIFTLGKYPWHDKKWLTHRSETPSYRAPMTIYEVHPGSWMRHPADNSYYTYKQLGDRLINYVSEMGYTHIELIGIAEYPYDGSWGYQVTGYYAPTSRYGNPEEFMEFVDRCHQAGIGVIVDWVPAHFPKDSHGLYMWDGEPLYEYTEPKKMSHPDWGTHIFDYGRPEVVNFLIANALYWLREYHIDGLRVDAVASMLYLDYGKEDGQWMANRDGGNINYEAVEFLKHLNSIIHTEVPGAVTIAEESTAYPAITKSPSDGGLGFDFKWNMGWMHDFLDYVCCDPYFRKYHHNEMTFGLTYIGSENFILVLSHDEVVHLKRSLIEKCPGDDEMKFACMRAAFAFFIGHPGKKLLFMGQDFGQRREWAEDRELDWFLLDHQEHRHLQDFFRGLLQLYRRHPALYTRDWGWPGFEWINANDADRSIFSFCRFSEDGTGNLLFIINFTPVERPDYRVGVPMPSTYTLLLDQGRGLLGRGVKKTRIAAVQSECDGREWSIATPLAPYGVQVFEFDSADPES